MRDDRVLREGHGGAVSPRVPPDGEDLEFIENTGVDLQWNRNARLALSVQVSRALGELGYRSLGATELPDTVSDKINWAFAGRHRDLIMYRNPALRRGFRNIDCGRGSGRCWRPDRVSSLLNWILSVTEDFRTPRSQPRSVTHQPNPQPNHDHIRAPTEPERTPNTRRQPVQHPH